MNIVKRVIAKIRRDKLNKKWRKIDFILNYKDFSERAISEFAEITEAEHQIGRYLNMKSIVSEIESANLKGDILEFGTWQGLGLIILSRLFNSPHRSYIGVDSFE